MLLPKFHLSPVVVVLVDGPPIGIKPQWGPSTDFSIWISWVCVLGSRKIEQSSDRRTILVSEKRYNTLMFPISWSNLPPSAPRTRIHSCNHRKSVKLTLHSWTFMINLIEYVRLVWDRELSCDKWYTFVQVRCVLIMWFINYVCALQPNKKKSISCHIRKNSFRRQQKSFKCQGCRNRNSAGCNLR